MKYKNFFQDLPSFKSILNCDFPERCENAILRFGFLPALTGHGVASKFSSVNYPLFRQRIGGTSLFNFEELEDS